MADLRPLLVVLALIGCATVDPTPPPSPYTLVPASTGLDVAGSGGREIGFGRDRDGALASASGVTGAPPQPVPCAGGRDGVRVDASLTMIFTGETFTGWQTEDAAAGTPCA
ncbi:MAG: hypothetical protein AAGE03_08805 [Pseudomonadota bacterium]